MRGALRTSRHARRDAVAAGFAPDECKRSRTAKSCGPDAPMAGVKLSGSSRFLGGDGDKQALVSPGRARNKLSHHRAGKAGLPPLNLYARVRFLFATFAHGTAGAACTRSSLRPLLFGANEFVKLGRMVSRECEDVFDRSPHEPTGRANARPMTGSATCGSAAVPHIAPLMRATGWLEMKWGRKLGYLDVILRSALFARVSKDGREHHPSRRGQVAAPQDDGPGVSQRRGRRDKSSPALSVVGHFARI
jgi:hypothetical protein